MDDCWYSAAPFLKILTKNSVTFILVQKWKGEGNGYFMVCKHEYILVSFFNHYGFLSHCTNERIDPVAQKGMRL